MDRDHPFGQGRDPCRAAAWAFPAPVARRCPARVTRCPRCHGLLAVVVGTRRGVELFIEPATTGGQPGSAATTELVTALPASLAPASVVGRRDELALGRDLDGPRLLFRSTSIADVTTTDAQRLALTAGRLGTAGGSSRNSTLLLEALTRANRKA